MRIVCISDTHNQHRGLVVPDGDVLLCAGDFTLKGAIHDVVDFNEWLGTLSHRWKIVIAGNHELTFDPAKPKFRPHVKSLISHAIYLENSEVDAAGLRVWGSPYSPEYCDWAFQLRSAEEAWRVWSMIPPSTDIVLVHGPPHGLGDEKINGDHSGCAELLKRVVEIRPKLVVSGHIHSGYGIRHEGGTTFVNACCVDEDYRLRNAPIVIDL